MIPVLRQAEIKIAKALGMELYEWTNEEDAASYFVD